MGNAGTVDFPSYMKDVHNDWLDHTGVDNVTSSVVDRINAATSPYSGVTPNNPATELNAIDTAVSAFSSLFIGYNSEVEWEEAITAVEGHMATLDLFSDAHIAALVDAFADVQDDQINNVVLPRFQAGLRNVNAVLSSSFVLGQAVIVGMRDRDVAKFQAEVREKLELLRPDFVGKVVDSIMRQDMTKLEMRKLLLHYQMEAQRLRIVAEKEYADGVVAIAVGNAKWPFEVFQMSANILGSIGGGTAVYGDSAKGPSTLQSALAGAISGAALGMQIGGGGWASAAIGGGLGLALGGLD